MTSVPTLQRSVPPRTESTRFYGLTGAIMKANPTTDFEKIIDLMIKLVGLQLEFDNPVVQENATALFTFIGEILPSFSDIAPQEKVHLSAANRSLVYKTKVWFGKIARSDTTKVLSLSEIFREIFPEDLTDTPYRAGYIFWKGVFSGGDPLAWLGTFESSRNILAAKAVAMDVVHVANNVDGVKRRFDDAGVATPPSAKRSFVQ